MKLFKNIKRWFDFYWCNEPMIKVFPDGTYRVCRRLGWDEQALENNSTAEYWWVGKQYKPVRASFPTLEAAQKQLDRWKHNQNLLNMRGKFVETS